MAERIFPLFGCLTVLLVVSCSKPATPPPRVVPPASESDQKATSPTCAIESVRKHKFDNGTELRVWTLEASRLKRLTARLLIATDGKVQTANEVDYEWDKWDPAMPEISAQLVLLLQDGKAFGVKDQRRPQMGLQVQGPTPSKSSSAEVGLVIEGEWYSRWTDSSYGTPLNRQSVIYSRLFVPTKDDLGTGSYSNTPESVVAASKGGRTVVSLEVEWVPQ